ncbi:MAG: capsule assembly Wzi family protein [Candidatus Oleimicrobiaceae bacterium]
MPQIVRLVLSLTIVLACALSADAQSVNLPLDHWAYRLLERLESKGLIRAAGLRALPLSREQLGQLIAAADKALREDPGAFSKSERDLLEQLKGEFCDDPAVQGLAVQSRYRERHLLRWQEGESYAFLDAIAAQAVDAHRADTMAAGERQWRTTGGLIVRGALEGKLAFCIDARNTLRRGGVVPEENFDPRHGLPLVTTGRNVYSDQAEAYVALSVWRAQLQAGRMQVHWGPGWRGGLLISRNAPPFDAFRITVPFRRISFSSLHAFLTRLSGPRYLAAHRLEVAVAHWLMLAGSESVLYGGRDVEFSYLNPLMPYHVAEHHLGDRDNNMLSIDVVIFPVRNVRVYAEFLLDDFSLGTNPFRYYGDKFGFVLGGHWVGPFGLKEAVLRAEYTRVEPFVYTHYDSLNVYLHYDRIIGHWLGPDADCMALAAEYQWSRDVFTQVWVQWRRQGRGDVWTPYPEGGSEQKTFLGGAVESYATLGVLISDQVRKDVFVSLAYVHTAVRNRGHVAGHSGFARQATIQVTVNY